jgi:hypothetical protein
MALPGKGPIRVVSRIHPSLLSSGIHRERHHFKNSLFIVPIADTARTKAHTARIYFSLTLFLTGINERKIKRQLNRKRRCQATGRAHKGSQLRSEDDPSILAE